MHPQRVLLGLLVAAILSACIVEPPGPPYADARLSIAIALSADAPVVIRTLEYSAVAGNMPISSVEGFLNVTGPNRELPGQVYHPDVWVSVLDLATGASPGRGFGIGHASIDGWGRDVACARIAGDDTSPAPAAGGPCTSRWTVIVRWMDPDPATEIPLQIYATLTAHAQRVPATTEAFEPRLAISEVGEPSLDGAPATVRASATGSARVTTSSPEESFELVLRVPAALLTGEPGFPRLGRLFFGSEVTDSTGPPADLRLELQVGEQTIDTYGGTAGEMDWLALCDPGIDCELPITLTTRPWISLSQRTAPPDGAMSIDWIVEARLEDFGSGAVLDGHLELVRR